MFIFLIGAHCAPYPAGGVAQYAPGAGWRVCGNLSTGAATPGADRIAARDQMDHANHGATVGGAKSEYRELCPTRYCDDTGRALANENLSAASPGIVLKTVRAGFPLRASATRVPGYSDRCGCVPG